MNETTVFQGYRLPKESFSELFYQDPTGIKLNYRLYMPQGAQENPVPLVVFLHGADSRGRDNKKPLDALYENTPFSLVEFQNEHPSAILLPQCPRERIHSDERQENVLMTVISGIIADGTINSNRIYLTGYSLGGIGTWHLVSRFPKFFAAAVPVCGALDPFTVRKARFTPIWAFHAEDDENVPCHGECTVMGKQIKEQIFGTGLCVEALRSIGCKNVKYTEYPAGYMQEKYGLPGHFCAKAAYSDPELIEWMFERDRKEMYDINALAPGVWHIDDITGSSFYLVQGKEKAVLIDTGWGKGPIRPMVEALTPLPVSLAVTHGHGDHFSHIEEFDEVFYEPAERPTMEHFIAYRGWKPVGFGRFTEIHDGDVIDLGGGVTLEVIGLFGHSPASITFLDRAHGCVFVGDALGSGSFVWMHLPVSLDLSIYRENILRFLEKIEGIEPLTFYVGHRYQEGGFPGTGRKYNPVCKELARDMAALCEKLLSGEIKGEPDPTAPFTGSEAFRATFGRATMTYTLDKLK